MESKETEMAYSETKTGSEETAMGSLGRKMKLMVTITISMGTPTGSLEMETQLTGMETGSKVMEIKFQGSEIQLDFDHEPTTIIYFNLIKQ